MHLRRRTAVVSLMALAALAVLLLTGPVTGSTAAPPAAGIGTAEQSGVVDTPVELARRTAVSTTAPTTTARPTTTTARPTTTTARPTTTTAAPTTTTAPPATGFARVVELVNQYRAQAGCAPVTDDARLDAAAQKHSVYQNEIQTMTHTGRGGTDAGQRITAEGFRWSTWGENVAYGYATPDDVMTAWMNSPHHRENILNCNFRSIGMGLSGSRNYWTQDFGTVR